MQAKILRKPIWLRKKINFNAHNKMDAMLDKGGVHTICHEAMCPNISECFSKLQATFLIGGNICTRACSFCNVTKGFPIPLDSNEPENVANMVIKLGLRHVVITSPTRDDLIDGGASHFCNTVSAIKGIDDSVTVELLIPDMQENIDALKLIANSTAEIIGHNLETVPRLYHVRKGAEYNRSLQVLRLLSSLNRSIATKSAIMLGLGEKEDEVLQLMHDLLDVGCRLLSIGQYLPPSYKHTDLVEYVEPEKFEFFRKLGMQMGFKYIKSSPYTRSSYMAHEYLEIK